MGGKKYKNHENTQTRGRLIREEKGEAEVDAKQETINKKEKESLNRGEPSRLSSRLRGGGEGKRKVLGGGNRKGTKGEEVLGGHISSFVGVGGAHTTRGGGGSSREQQ